MIPSPAVTAWDAWLRQQANRDDPVGETARHYVDGCERSNRPALSVDRMRSLVQSDSAPHALKALGQTWTEYTTSDPCPALQGPRGGNIPPRRRDRAAARAMLAVADAQGLKLTRHKPVEDAAGGPAGVERTDEQVTLIPEAYGWTRAELEADDEEEDPDV